MVRNRTSIFMDIPVSDNRFMSALTVTSDTVLMAVLCVGGLLGILFNVTVLLVGFKNRRQLKPVELYVMNVAVGDLGTILTLYPMVVPSLQKHQWLWGDTGCSLYGFFGAFFGYVVMMSLTALSVSRYVVFKSIDAGANSISRRQVCGVIIATYVYCFLWAILPLLGWASYGVEAHGTSCTVDWRHPNSTSFIFALLFAMLVLPTFIMMTSYTAIARKIRQTQCGSSEVKPHVVKMSVLICANFVLSWLPYGIVTVWLVLQEPDYRLPPVVSALPPMFAKVFSVNNPWVYFVSSKKFRHQVRELFCPNKVSPGNSCAVVDQPAQTQAQNTQVFSLDNVPQSDSKSPS